MSLILRKRQFHPRQLFRAGEPGIIFDPSDLSNVFQDAAGTTPVTGVEQPVGLILDQSGRGNHASQSTAAARPVLKRSGDGRYYLFFDGVDDCLFTGNINFSANDKMSACAGVRKLSDAAIGIVAELSATIASNNGSFNIAAPGSIFATTANFATALKGDGSFTGYDCNLYAAPFSAVITALYDIGAGSRVNEVIPRVNGLVNQSTPGGSANTGSGNFGNYPLYVGRRNNSTLSFNGNLYSLVIIGRLLSDIEIQQVERWINRKTGAY